MRDESGFVEFAQTSRARLRRTAYLLCGDWDRASDHVQEGLIRVYVAWPRLERAGREYAYARKAVVSAVLDHGRRRSSREVPSISGEPDDTRAATGDLAEQVTSRAALMAALADLAPRQRACVVLRYFEDMTVPQVAETLGIAQGTVKRYLSQGLARLGEIVTDDADDDVEITWRTR